MSIHRFFRRRFPLRSRARGIAFLCFILLMYGCGEETVDNPLGGTRETADFVPVSSIYYPMTVSSRSPMEPEGFTKERDKPMER